MNAGTEVSIMHDSKMLLIEQVTSIEEKDGDIELLVNALTDTTMKAVRATRLVSSTVFIGEREFDFMGCSIGHDSITLTGTTLKGK